MGAALPQAARNRVAHQLEDFEAIGVTFIERLMQTLSA